MYKLIATPDFAKSHAFDSFSKKNAKEYFEWFESIKNERIAYMTSIVQKDNPVFYNDYSRDSVVALNKWLVSNINLENSTKNVSILGNQVEKLPLQGEKRTFVLSESTKSKIFDVGMYIGEAIVNADAKKKWGYLLKPKSYIHYGQPIILASHPADNLNPYFLIVNTILFCFDEKLIIPNDFLVEAYDYSVDDIAGTNLAK